MHIPHAFASAGLAAAALLALASPAAAQGINPNPTGPSTEQPTTPPAAGGDRITAAIVVRELRALGFQPELKAGERGLPNVQVSIDGYRWAILFYACDEGAALDQRRCGNIQFFSGYTVTNPISMATMNKWNTDKRFARGYTFTTSDGKYGARVEIDVIFTNTGADPARTFRAYYAIMKIQAADFRKLINFN